MHHKEALERLRQGNQRFAAGLRSVDSLAITADRRQQLAEDGQKPFAIVLACADSRVPAEIVFDCGLGQLFVVRVAGNIVAPSLIGSIEFAAENFGTQLCVVMGHSQCGAVSAAINSVLSGKRPPSDNIQKIVLEIAPSVRASLSTGLSGKSDELLVQTTKRNVEHSVAKLLEESNVITRLTEEGRLRLVGATYDLHSGLVDFFDAMPSSERGKSFDGKLITKVPEAAFTVPQ